MCLEYENHLSGALVLRPHTKHEFGRFESREYHVDAGLGEEQTYAAALESESVRVAPQSGAWSPGTIWLERSSILCCLPEATSPAMSLR